MAGKFVNNNLDFVVMIIVGAALLVPFGYGVVAYASSAGGSDSGPFIEKPDPKHTACIKDVEYMRLHHSELLKDIREKSVREGIRGDIKLNDCQTCHTNRAKFCDRCHEMASIRLDCFKCHYYPK
ncbi:MAG: hypothetical protein ACYTFG_05225 [Planctomycetota bacterium]|jgi:hypothetical protein